MNQQPITLEDIRKRKLQLKKQLTQKKKNIGMQASSLFSPVPVRDKFDLGYKWVSNGLAIYDGLKMGWKVMRYFTKK
ncbi:MAG: hypothetical protein MJZ73_05220 [Bacteroidaceae bacterium]|nr:hypothetical protein [Bacteroidaceae bacterium]